METHEDPVRQLEQERARAREAESRAEQERREKEEAQARLAELGREKAPTPFCDYIRHAEELLHSTFYVDPVPAPGKVSLAAATDVGSKFFPRFLRPWDGFAAAHAATFSKLATAFGDQALFPSLLDVEAIRRELCPGDMAEKEDLEVFMATAIENPAARIVSRYLADFRPGSTVSSVEFRNNAYGVLPVEELELPTKTSTVNRWGFALDRDNKRTRIFAGEYNATHELTAEMIRRGLATNPSGDFFSWTKAPAGRRATQAEESAIGPMSVVYIFYQAYHSMLTSGLEFGYIAFGDGLIFLRIPEDDPLTLHYHWSVFPVPAIADQDARRKVNLGTRTPQETAVAHIASFCLWAAETTPRPASWIKNAERLARKWPMPYELEPEPSDPESPSGPSKRARQDGGNKAAPSGNGKFVAEPPTLPYCTQACLLGLSRGQALDDKCPNVALHRAAAARRSTKSDKRGKGGSAPPAKPLPTNGHALTAAQLQRRVATQVAANVDKDIECLDKYGLYGRRGTLFKITLTGYGYTFVAKGVQAADTMLLEEENKYNALANVQGRLVPVCLGLTDVKPIPLHTGAEVRHLLLLSYAGPHLASPKKDLPSDVDLEQEGSRTAARIAAAGLWNDDVRRANLAWNAEARHVMQLDFDQTHMRCYPLPPVPGSPLADRTVTNIAHGGSGQDEDGGQPAKRVRREE